MRMVGIVCGAFVALTTVITSVVNWIQKPLIVMWQEERQERRMADSLHTVKLEEVGRDVAAIRSAITDPPRTRRVP